MTTLLPPLGGPRNLLQRSSGSVESDDWAGRAEPFSHPEH